MKQLKKPGWRPPNWAFACVWTYLYSTMGYASYRVWVELDKPDLLAPASLPSPLKLFILQILLNWLWTPIFFGLKQITMITWQDLLVPYLVWLILATALTVTIWKANLQWCYGYPASKKK
nr:translocator protein-like [Cherax quadricarinatus]